MSSSNDPLTSAPTSNRSFIASVRQWAADNKELKRQAEKEKAEKLAKKASPKKSSKPSDDEDGASIDGRMTDYTMGGVESQLMDGSQVEETSPIKPVTGGPMSRDKLEYIKNAMKDLKERMAKREAEGEKTKTDLKAAVGRNAANKLKEMPTLKKNI